MGQKLNVLNQYIDTELVMTEKSDDKISEYNVNEYFVH